MKNLGTGPVDPLIMDPTYVIYAFGSMLSSILCERQKIQKVTNWSALVPEISSEQCDLWSFHLLHGAEMQWNEGSGISMCVVLQIAEVWDWIDTSSLLQKYQLCMLAIPC